MKKEWLYLYQYKRIKLIFSLDSSVTYSNLGSNFLWEHLKGYELTEIF